MSEQRTITSGVEDSAPRNGKKKPKRKPYLIEARWLDRDFKKIISRYNDWWVIGRYVTADARDKALERHNLGRSMWSASVSMKKIEFRARDQ